MDAATVKPTRLTGIAALRWGWRFALDPLTSTRRAFDTFGPCVILAALPLIRPSRVAVLGVPLVLTAGAAFYSELMSRPDMWRGVSVLPGGPKGSAARRMSPGLMPLTGDQHAHYRKLLAQPLRRSRVETLTKNMARLAETEIASWPVGETIDLWEYGRRLMQGFAVEFLFGGTSEQSRAVTEMGCRMMERKWDWRAFAFPINLSVTIYGQIVREAESLERRMIAWVAAKRGHPDGRDIAAVLVNSRDVGGNPLDDAAIVSQLPSLFGLSSEGGQSVLIWTLLLLSQHPDIAARLRDELQSKLGGTAPSLDRAGDLPFLDAVVKEAMRVLPPVPLQFRVAQQQTTIAGQDMPRGTRVVLNTFLTNRAPGLYPDPDTFRPERWFAISPSAFEFPVFGAGPHICPGYWFDLTAVKIAVAAIVMRYRMDLPPNTRIDFRTQPTLRPRARLGVALRPANGAEVAPTPVGGNIRRLVTLPA